MSFDEIGDLVGALPASATARTAWWSNDASGSSAQARAWLNAGREVERVDQNRRVVRFTAPQWRRGA